MVRILPRRPNTKPAVPKNYNTQAMTTQDRIQSVINRHMPGASLVQTWPLSGGISAQMTAFEVERQGVCQKLIARQPNKWWFEQRPNAAQVEFDALRSLFKQGLPVQKPLFVEEQSEAVPHPFFVMRYIEGRPDIAPTNVDSYLQKYADQLVAIHRTSTQNLGIESGLAESLPNRQTFNEALREPEIRAALTDRKRPDLNPSVLRHGDFWPGNILWRDGEIAAVIDWEEATIGNPLADLAICRLDLLWILDFDAVDKFTQLYQAQMNLALDDLPWWDLWASLRPAANLPEWAPAYTALGRPDITAETMTRDHQAFVTQALKKLDK